MREEIPREYWLEALRDFNAQNQHRPTRLEVIGQVGDVMRDYWLENGLPLLGLTMERASSATPRVGIALGGQNSNIGHMTHVVSGVRRLVTERNFEGEIDGLELEDNEGNRTILRFEMHNAAVVAATR